MRIEDQYEPPMPVALRPRHRAADDIAPWQGIVAMLAGVGCLVLIGLQLAPPLRQELSARFLHRGDQLMLQQEYEGAAQEYRRAARYDGQNAAAKERERMAQAAPYDMAVAGEFYRERGVAAVTERLDRALAQYSTPKEAAEAGLAFYGAKEYVYAQYPLERAVKLDPQYAEAWHYLGLTYRELAKENARYQKMASEALAKRDGLTLKYRE